MLDPRSRRWALCSLAFAMAVPGCAQRSSQQRPAPNKPRIAAALGGGGYRAALHGLGALKALDELGLREQTDMVGAISGGSLAASYYTYRLARDAKNFRFEDFEADLLDIIANYEFARTVVTTELLTAGPATIETVSICAMEQLGSWLGGGASSAGDAVLGFAGWVSQLVGAEGDKEANSGGAPTSPKKAKISPSSEWLSDALSDCIRLSDPLLAQSSLANAMEDFTGPGCPPTPTPGPMAKLRKARDTWVTQCAEQGALGLGAMVTGSVIEQLASDDEARANVQRSFCRLKWDTCSRSASPQATNQASDKTTETTDPSETSLAGRRPFVALLDAALFAPWRAQQRTVRMNDLRGPGVPILLLGATPEHRPGIWAATQEGILTHTDAGKGPLQIEAWPEDRGATVAAGVAASACHPFFCAPHAMEDDGEILIDGGVHDNLGVDGIRSYIKAKGAVVDLLVVADPARPAEGQQEAIARGETGRFDSVIRLHDRLIDQVTALRLDRAQKDPHRCGVIHVSLAKDPSVATLAAIPTDLKPIPVKTARTMVAASTKAFKKAFQANACVQAQQRAQGD